MREEIGIEKRYIVLMLSIFVISRFILLKVGIGLSLDPLYSYWQYLDPKALENNLLQSIFYLHAQPPFFNLIIGIVLKLFPNSYETVFQNLFYLFSLTIYFSIFQLLYLYGISRKISFLLATLFILSPEAILYENYFFYTWFISSLLILSVLLLRIYQYSGRALYIFLFISAIFIVAFTRSLFHLLYIIPLLALILHISGRDFSIKLFSLLLFTLLSALYLKNYILFGTFSSSSWMGMNLFKIARYCVDKDEMKRLIRNREISPSCAVEPFSTIDRYPKRFSKVPKRFENIDVLSREYKTSHYGNRNHYGYIEISKELRRDSIFLIRKHPFAYMKSVIKAWGYYSLPSWSYFSFRKKLDILRRYHPVLLFEDLLYNLQKRIFALKNNFSCSYISILSIPIAVLIVIVSALLSYRRGRVDYAQLFAIYNILFIAIIGNMLESGENNRFRVMSDPILYTYFVIAIFLFLKGRKASSKPI